jgi:hypothetical protein
MTSPAAALALALALLAAGPALAQGGSQSWRELEALRQDRFQLGLDAHLRTRDSRWLAHELRVGNRDAAGDLRRELAGDDRRVARARARLRQDERTAAAGKAF